MRRRIIASSISAAILLTIVVSGFPITSAAEGRDSTRPEFVPGEILMKFKPSAQAIGKIALMGELGATTLTTFNTRAEHWRLGPGVNVEQAIQRLLASGLVEYAEPNYIVSAELVPNDPRFPELYGMNNTGLGTIGSGLLRLEAGRVDRIARENGLYDVIAYEVVEDGRGNLWMSCNRGIFRVARAVGLMTAYVSNGNGTPEVLDYLRPHVDAYKVDLKGMREEGYRQVGRKLSTVLDTGSRG